MSSLFKAGKKLVQEIKPVLMGPDKDQNHAHSQSLHAGYSIPQQYAPGIAPSATPSPYFNQGVQQDAPSVIYGQSSQYQNSYQQSPALASNYCPPQQRQQTFSQHNTAQSPQYRVANMQAPGSLQPVPSPQSQSQLYAPHQQQSPNALTSPHTSQSFLPVETQQIQHITQQHSQLQSHLHQVPQLAQQYPPSPQQNIPYTNHLTQFNSPASSVASSPAPPSLPSRNNFSPPNYLPSTEVSLPTPPSQPCSPPVENVSQWGTPTSSLAPLRVPASAPFSASSAVELPASNVSSQSTLQFPASRQDFMRPATSSTPPHRVQQLQPTNNTEEVQKNQISQSTQNKNDSTQEVVNTGRAFFQHQEPPQLQQHPGPSLQSGEGYIYPPQSNQLSQSQSHTHQPIQMTHTYTPQPGPTTEVYFPPPPRTPVGSNHQSPTPFQYSSLIHSPSPQQPPYLSLHVQSQDRNSMNQLQQPESSNQQLQPYIPQATQQHIGSSSEHPYRSKMSATVTPQPPISDTHLVSLQHEFHALSVVPHLSPSFREAANPKSLTPKPARPAQETSPTPTVLRIHSDNAQTAVRKILCLDGGGVRGLASLIIVKHLMQRLETLRGGRLEPWQEFDMIAGTSTGGLIAIMLGRLRMGVDEAINAYKSMSQRIFTPLHTKSNIAGRAITKFKAEGKFESEPLEQVVKEICRSRGLSEMELLKDASSDSPKVFVCAAQGENADAVVIRSYPSGSGEYDDLYEVCRIWEAARATSAATTFFDPIQIGYQKYVDGALRYNNPIEKADQESGDLWPNQERMIVSVGTGNAPGPNVLASNIAELGKTLAKIITGSEEENSRFRRRNKDMVENDLLFRFNVAQGLANVKLDEWEAIGEIMAHTGTYLKLPDTAMAFTTCANKMKESGQRLGYIAGDDLQVYQKMQKMATIYCEFCEDCHKGIPYLENMYLCVECQMYTCGPCHDSHERTHIRNMLRFDIIQWLKKLPNIASSAPCWYCAKESKTRWECQTCNRALCRNCVGYWDRRVEFFNEHRKQDPDGRIFFAVYPPYWSTKSEWITKECRCLDGRDRIVWHCERCHKVLPVGSRGYDCRTCHIDFGSAQYVCQACFESDAEHHEKHRFGTFEIMSVNAGPETVDGSVKQLWACTQCPERLAENTHHMHEHLHLKLVITPFLDEIFRRMTYRECYRREIQDLTAQQKHSVTIPFRCDFCTRLMAFDQLGSLCLSPFCVESFCASCTSGGRPRHRHFVYQFIVKRSVQDFMNQVTCNYCSQSYRLMLAQGLWCPDCSNHFMCIDCIEKVGKTGAPAVTNGLPHQKLLKQCKVKKGWELYLLGGN